MSYPVSSLYSIQLLYFQDLKEFLNPQKFIVVVAEKNYNKRLPEQGGCVTVGYS